MRPPRGRAWEAELWQSLGVCQGVAAAFASMFHAAASHHFPGAGRGLRGSGNWSDRCATGRCRRPRGPWRRGRSAPPGARGWRPWLVRQTTQARWRRSWRMSSSLSLRASISAGTTLAASPFRCGKRRTAIGPLLVLGRLQIRRSTRRSISSCRSRRTPASKATEQTVSARAWLNSSAGTGRSPIAEHFAAGYGAEVLIRVGVDAAGEEMHRAVAEQEVRSRPGACSKTYRGRRTGCRRWAGAWRCRGRGPGLRRSPHCRRRSRCRYRAPSGRGVGGGPGCGRHPGGAPSSRHGAGPGAGGMGAAALADDDGVAQTVGDVGDAYCGCCDKTGRRRPGRCRRRRLRLRRRRRRCWAGSFRRRC